VGVLPREPWFLYGRNLNKVVDSTFDETSNMTTGRDIKLKPNGWYFLVRLKKINKQKECIATNTFETIKCLCFPTLFFQIRKPFSSKKYSIIYHFTWIPVE
jgi:hypothetical protein